MVKNFIFSVTPKIIFGEGAINKLPEEILRFGKNIILFTGKYSFYNLQKSEVIFNLLNHNNIRFIIEKIEKEPTATDIDNIIEKYRNTKFDVIVAIGGGSVIDTAKAVSAMLTTDDSVRNYIEGVGNKHHPGTKIPFIAIPTTSGTGSEATNNSVIAEIGINGFKRSLRHENFIPNVAIVDSSLTLTCPRTITAYSGMDALSQLIEAYLSSKASHFTDLLCLDGLQNFKKSFLNAYFEGDKNISARTDIAYASLTSGICLNNSGLGLVHGFASSIGGYIYIPHGVICGKLLAPFLKTIIKKVSNKNDDITYKKIINLSKIFIEDDASNEDMLINKFVEKLEVITDLVNIPKLSTFGLKIDDTDLICSNTALKNTPCNLSFDDIKNILLSAL
jgi:alcohol dehydrogenase class IV